MTADRRIVARRRAHDAASRFSIAVSTLREQAEQPRWASERWLAGYEAETLLWKVLGEADQLVPLLNGPEDEVWLDDCERKARDLYQALRNRRLAAKLDESGGRTPEEAAAFAAKARELRR